MKLFGLCIITLVYLPSFGSALSINSTSSHNATLIKRGPEVNYLSNCWRNPPDDSPDEPYRASYANYYQNQDASQNGEIPDDISSEYRDWYKGGYWIVWEGVQQNLLYPRSGVTIQTHIDKDAQSKKVGELVGFADRTSDWKRFNCYKDNNRGLYIKSPPVPDGTQNLITCDAHYFCN